MTKPSQEIAKIDPQEQALIDQSRVDLAGDADDLVVPILKVCQPLTQEVSDGEASPGDLLNSLTGENFGSNVEFVVSGFYKGRFRAEKDGTVVCSGSGGVCGCHGGAYQDCPDSEEQWRAAVNRGDKEWGQGPPCATTYNFVGYVVGSEVPVRLSLMRSAQKSAKKWVTMLRFQPALWDSVFTIETSQATSRTGNHKYQSVNIKQSRKTKPEERQQAVELAQGLASRNAQYVGDEAEGVGGESKRPEGAEKSSGLDY